MEGFIKLIIVVVVLICLFFAIGSTSVSIIDVSSLDNTTINVICIDGCANSSFYYENSNILDMGDINAVF